MSIIPSYIKLYNSGELHERIKILNAILEDCRLCPRDCRKNRLKGEIGVCKAGAELMVSSVFPHFGEEPPLVGYFGSGTIFLTHCNLRCIFCQNYDISHSGEGKEVTTNEFADYMIYLQRLGCHNINFVTPTHYAPQIVSTLPKAIELGLELPLVWNCGGYESIEVTKLLDDIVDIYMPDMKYADDSVAISLSGAPRYVEHNRGAVLEMLRQVGHLRIDEEGIAASGLIIRHLVLPEGMAGSVETLPWIAANLGQETHVALMSQYFPAGDAASIAGIDRRLNAGEYDAALTALERAGLDEGWVQELEEERKPI